MSLFERTRLNGARVVLTGASSGIGRALAGGLARVQRRVVLAARSAEKLQELARLIEGQANAVRAVPADVAEPEQRRRLITEAVSAFGGIDILINTAGVGA